MGKSSKRFLELAGKVQEGKLYDFEDALNVLKELHSAKFDESVELSVKLGLDVKKTQQPVRGSVVLPYGIGKKVRILVFAQGEHAAKSKELGADYVGGEELVEKVKKGWVDFDTVIATPDMMKSIASLGKVLGPRGMMPSPKTGTVTFELDKIISELQKGRVNFKMDKEGNIHMPVGKISFDSQSLQENVREALGAILSSKPVGAKGTFILSLYLSLTMSPSIPLDTAKLTQLVRGN